MNPNVLLVDNDPEVRIGLSNCLCKAGFSVRQASSLSEADRALRSEKFHAVLLDIRLPDGDGTDWISDLRRAWPEILIVLITGESDTSAAMEAMRRGADHFLSKPVRLPDLEVYLRKNLEVDNLRRRDLLHRSQTFQPFLGNSQAAQKMLSLLTIAAEKDSTVLLQGETGAGKGVFARWIHDRSTRASKPFLEINCSSFQGESLAKELFGYAFASTLEAQPGILEVINGGTLFLEEIDNMDLAVQSQLLRALEERRYHRLGEIYERDTDFRLICSTARNLIHHTFSGFFRKELYFFVNVFPVEIPPLRRRIDDLPHLLRHLMLQLGAQQVEIMLPAMRMLKGYPWPGNIRELISVLQRALLLSSGKALLTPDHFPGLEAQCLLPSSVKESPEQTTSGAPGIAIFETSAGEMPVPKMPPEVLIKDRLLEALEKSVKTAPRPAQPPHPEPEPQKPLVETRTQPASTWAPKQDLGLYYFRCALQSFNGKNYWAAVEYCKKALEFRKEARVYELMGNAFATHPRFRKPAMESYKQALEMDPDNAGILRRAADLCFVMKDYAFAKACYEKLLKSSPNDRQAAEHLQEIMKTQRSRI